MADVQKINSSNPIKRTGGVYHVGIAAPTATSNAVDDDDTIIMVGAQNAGDNVADTYPGEVCIVTSDGIAVAKNSADCWVLPVDSSGAATEITTGSCLTGDGTPTVPLQVVVASTGCVTCNDDGLSVKVVDGSGLEMTDNGLVLDLRVAEGLTGLGVADSRLGVLLDPTGGIVAHATKGLQLDLDYTNRGLEWLAETSGAVTVDWSTPPYNKAIRLLDDATLTFTAPLEPGPLVFMVDQGPTGGNTVTWPELSGSTPVLEAGANNRTVVNLFYDGTYYHV